MQKAVELLGSEEQETISKAVFAMVKQSPFIPATVKTQYGDIADNCIAVFAVAGAIVSKRYIDGGFIGQFPFALRYRSKPSSNEDRIQREEILNKTALWLSGKTVTHNGQEYKINEYPSVTEDRTIREVEQTQPAFVVDKSNDGTVDVQVLLRLSYKKKGM